MPFTMRLDLMKNSNQITDITYQKVNQIVDLLKANLKAEHLELATTFVTHSAIAINRTLSNQAIDDLDPMIAEDVESRDTYDSAVQILDAVQAEISLEFNAAESTLILAHLCSLLEKTQA